MPASPPALAPRICNTINQEVVDCLPSPNCTPNPFALHWQSLVAVKLLHSGVPFDTTVSLKYSTPDVLSIDKSAIQISIIDCNMQN